MVNHDTDGQGIGWTRVMPRLGFILVEVLFLAIAHVFGGPPWTVVGMIAFVALAFTQTSSGFRGGALALVVPSLLWLALFRITGNRELFFPYTMFLATGVAVRAAERTPWLGILRGGAVVTAFMILRILQNATNRVLAVELVIAVAILALSLMMGSWNRTHAIVGNILIVTVSSLLAYASLAL